MLRIPWGCLTSSHMIAFVHKTYTHQAKRAERTSKRTKRWTWNVYIILRADCEWWKWLIVTLLSESASAQLKGLTNYEDSSTTTRANSWFWARKFENKYIRHHHWIYRYLKSHKNLRSLSLLPLKWDARIYGPKCFCLTARILHLSSHSPFYPAVSSISRCSHFRLSLPIIEDSWSWNVGAQHQLKGMRWHSKVTADGITKRETISRI